MIEPRYKWEIAIAGLIHDIGKFYQKSEENQIGKVKVYRQSIEHTLIAEEFINAHIEIFKQAFTIDEIKFITECAVRHHGRTYDYKGDSDRILVSSATEEYKKYCMIICEADNISSSERSDEQYGARNNLSKKENSSLEPPFSRVISDKEPNFDDISSLLTPAYKLSKFSTQNIQISNIGRFHQSKDMTDFVKSFDKEVDTLKVNTKQELFNKLNNLIKDYTWCIPSDCKEIIRDVSLYQHLITTSAIASTIYNDLLANSKDEEFVTSKVKDKKDNIAIIHIKLTNTEQYVLNTNSASFDTLEEIHNKNCSLTDLFDKNTHSILDKLQLTEANIIIQGGYEKYIITGKSFIDDLKLEIKRINKELLNTYLGKIYISYKISDLTFEQSEKSRYDRMSPILSNEKQYWFNGLQELFTENGKWSTSLMLLKPSKIDIESIEKSYGTNNPDYISFFDWYNNINKISNKVSIITIDGDKTLETMRNGFISNDKDYGTISRLCTYSNTIGNFFTNYIKKNFEDIAYILNIDINRTILICEYYKSLDIVKDIIDSYKSYTNNKMTLSVSIETVNINSRLSDFLVNCEENLKECKSLGGNRVKIREHNITYEKLVRYSELKNIILNDLENGVNQAVFNRLAQYSDMYNEYLKTNNISCLRCVPLYSRHKNRDSKGVNTELIEIINEAFSNIFKNKDTTDNILVLLKDIIYDAQQEYRMERI